MKNEIKEFKVNDLEEFAKIFGLTKRILKDFEVDDFDEISESPNYDNDEVHMSEYLEELGYSYKITDINEDGAFEGWRLTVVKVKVKK